MHTTIDVQRIEVLKTGAKNGRPWTLYKVHATGENGHQFDRELRTFEQLPTGKTVVELESETVRDTPTYTVKLPKAYGGGSAKRGGSPEQRLAEVEARLADLEKKYANLARAVIHDDPSKL